MEQRENGAGANTKARILEKALELFSAQGYDAVSVGDIAKAVGITPQPGKAIISKH